jgi:hypothetical protein
MQTWSVQKRRKTFPTRLFKLRAELCWKCIELPTPMFPSKLVGISSSSLFCNERKEFTGSWDVAESNLFPWILFIQSVNMILILGAQDENKSVWLI